MQSGSVKSRQVMPNLSESQIFYFHQAWLTRWMVGVDVDEFDLIKVDSVYKCALPEQALTFRLNN